MKSATSLTADPEYSAELLGTDPPPDVTVEDADLPPFAVHCYVECKRARNVRVKQVLGMRRRYPTYR